MWCGKLSRKDRKFISFKELLPKVTVKEPVTHNSWDKGKFTTYLICIKTEHPAFHLRLSAVRRRFSELRWLHKMMKVNHPHVYFPKPPSKRVFAERFDPEFINSRMVEIQEFLNELLVTDTVLSDAAFHFFIQTDLTPGEIEEHLNGTLAESIVQEAWQNAGHLHSSSYIVNETTIPHQPQEITMNEEDLQPVHQMSQSLASSEDSSFNNSAFSASENNSVFLAAEDSSVLQIPEDSSVLQIPEDSSVLQIPENNSVLQIPENSSVLQIPENNSVFLAAEDSSVLQIPEDSSVIQIPEDSSVLQIPEDSSVLQIPENSSVLQIPEDSCAFSVPEDNSAHLVSEDSSVFSVPEVTCAHPPPEDNIAFSVHGDNSAQLVSEDNSALSVHGDNSALSVPEDNSAFSVPEDNSALSVPETTNVLLVTDTTNGLPVAGARDVPHQQVVDLVK